MDVIYAYLIIKGQKTFKQVPAYIKEKVRAALIAMEAEEFIVE